MIATNDNCRIEYINLPVSVRGFVVRSFDYYTIVVNCRLSYDQQQKVVKHELSHIECDDFECCDLALIEYYTHLKGGEDGI